MFQVDEKPETIHLYVVREEEPRPSVLPMVASFLLLLCVIAVGMLFPYHQPLEHKTLRVPAIFLPLKSFTASAPIIPTGIKTYPPMSAHGTLTLTNGSVISQEMPSGLIFTGKDGVEVVTDNTVFVPAGSAAGFGIAQVAAHAVISGKNGNISTYDIDRVEGTSIYIRNTHPFTGGKDAYSVKVVTPQDRQIGIDTARASLTTQQAHIKAFLAFPCKETTQVKNNVVGLSWACQYVTYNVPSYMKVTHIRLVGKTLLVDVVFVERPRRTWVK